MSFLKIPYDILHLISQKLELKDLNSLLQAHSFFYAALNPDLYARNLKQHKGSALWWAAKQGCQGTLQHALNAGADVQWESHYWARTAPFPRAKHLRYRKPSCRGEKPSRKHPISNAAKNGHTIVVAKFLDWGVNINYKSRWGRSPLALAARGGHFDTVELLARRGACLLSVDLDGHRPIAYAAREGHDAIADYLLRELRRRFPQLRGTAKADVQILLQYAAQRGNEARVRHLLSTENADPNFQFTVESWTPLCAAVKHAPPNMILLLLENGANPNACASPRKIGDPVQTVNTTPLQLAIEREDSHEVFGLLLSHGANPRLNSASILRRAAMSGKFAEFLLLLIGGADIESPALQNDLMQTALKSGCQPIVDLLARKGVEPILRRRPCFLYRPRRPDPGSIEDIEWRIGPDIYEADLMSLLDSDT